MHQEKKRRFEKNDYYFMEMNALVRIFREKWAVQEPQLTNG